MATNITAGPIFQVDWKEAIVRPKGNHCPECGRFMRLSVGADGQCSILVGFCSKERRYFILDELGGVGGPDRSSIPC